MTEQNPTDKPPEKAPAQAPMKRVASVHFSRASKIEYYLAENLNLKLHDLVVIRGDHGNVIGRVVDPCRDVPASEVATNIRTIIRKAGKEDVERFNQDMEKAREGFELCAQKIKERNLQMKLIDVAYEDSKAVFFFSAEERIDFRTLVKDLANSLHMRIEMRQIGARDEAKAMGAVGPCGLVCCCEQFLEEFTSISIAMAKNQGLSPNPAKLTGMCGKLKCCLSYENSTYLEERKDLPPIGAKVKTKEGEGTVTNLDVLKHICQVRVNREDGSYEDSRVPCENCQVLSRPKKNEKKGKDNREGQPRSDEKRQRK